MRLYAVFLTGLEVIVNGAVEFAPNPLDIGCFKGGNRISTTVDDSSVKTSPRNSRIRSWQCIPCILSWLNLLLHGTKRSTMMQIWPKSKPKLFLTWLAFVATIELHNRRTYR